MKPITILFLAFFTFLAGCSKDDTPKSLPPATQTGEGIFACLVNGEVFVHEDGLINCFYQYVDGGYYFGITGKRNHTYDVSALALSTLNKEINEGETYQLSQRIDGNAIGGGLNSELVYTNAQYTGEMTITNLDFENHIVSGTFWFNLKHPVTGDTIKIRKGRFDALFYQ